MTSTSTNTWRQHTDPAFAALLRYLHQQTGQRAQQRFCDVLAAAIRAGWHKSALGVAAGLSREWIRRCALRGNPDAVGLPPIPDPPSRPQPEPPPQRVKPQLNDDQAAELRQLAAVARQVNGATPPGHPARAATERLSALLQEHVTAGMSMSYLSRALGMSSGAVLHRLGRHRYRRQSPSQQHAYGPSSG